jgi:hypothetical protein
MRWVGVPVGLLLKKDPLSASPKLCIRPASLWQALWAQLVLAIDGNLNLRACVQCRKWFTLEAGKGRSDKEYCTNACRMRAYRRRKAGDEPYVPFFRSGHLVVAARFITTKQSPLVQLGIGATSALAQCTKDYLAPHFKPALRDQSVVTGSGFSAAQTSERVIHPAPTNLPSA